MGTQRLTWTGEALQFLGRTAYGSPLAIGGDVHGVGAKPSDLLPLSLAACTAYDTVVILKKQRQDLQGLEIELTTSQDPEPPWAFTSIHMRFVISGAVDLLKAQKAVALAESRYCAVAATLRSVVELTHDVEVIA